MFQAMMYEARTKKMLCDNGCGTWDFESRKPEMGLGMTDDEKPGGIYGMMLLLWS
jgi:hypothetical protein